MAKTKTLKQAMLKMIDDGQMDHLVLGPTSKKWVRDFIDSTSEEELHAIFHDKSTRSQAIWAHILRKQARELDPTMALMTSLGMFEPTSSDPVPGGPDRVMTLPSGVKVVLKSPSLNALTELHTIKDYGIQAMRAETRTGLEDFVTNPGIAAVMRRTEAAGQPQPGYTTDSHEHVISKAGIVRLAPTDTVKQTMGAEINHVLRHNGTNFPVVFWELIKQVRTTARKDVTILSCTVTLTSGEQVPQGIGREGISPAKMHSNLLGFVGGTSVQHLVGVMTTGCGWQEHFQITNKLAYSFKGVPGKDHRVILSGGELLISLDDGVKPFDYVIADEVPTLDITDRVISSRLLRPDEVGEMFQIHSPVSDARKQMFGRTTLGYAVLRGEIRAKLRERSMTDNQIDSLFKALEKNGVDLYDFDINKLEFVYFPNVDVFDNALESFNKKAKKKSKKLKRKAA